MRRGFRYADRLVRPAMVGVSEPAHLPFVEEPTDEGPTSEPTDND
jgi:hypothetical protein